MDPIVTSIITSVAANYFTQYSYPVVENFFKTAFKHKPELQEKLVTASTPVDIEAVFAEAVDVIDANADQGELAAVNLILEAARGIRFDHSSGTVSISGTTISAPIIVTGGSNGASGQTSITGGTTMKTRGTSISVGKGASITMTGGASIKQT
jgi:hypothetical protein